MPAYVFDFETKPGLERPTGKRYLIHDRDPLFTDAFRAILHPGG